jgi:hypothetical protein
MEKNEVEKNGWYILKTTLNKNKMSPKLSPEIPVFQQLNYELSVYDVDELEKWIHAILNLFNGAVKNDVTLGSIIISNESIFKELSQRISSKKLEFDVPKMSHHYPANKRPLVFVHCRCQDTEFNNCQWIDVALYLGDEGFIVFEDFEGWYFPLDKFPGRTISFDSWKETLETLDRAIKGPMGIPAKN